jgi:hypothetical protein
LNQSGLPNALAGGWEVAGIITFQSGFPYTVLSDIDFSNTNSFFPRPDRTCNGAGPQTVAEWFNVNCFNSDALSQALGNSTPRFGNSGRKILTGQSIQQWDVSLIKRNPLTEKLNLEFRADFFYMFNHPNFGLPNPVGAGLFEEAHHARPPAPGIEMRIVATVTGQTRKPSAAHVIGVDSSTANGCCQRITIG